MAVTRTQATELYVALFGRAPDTQGLGFWMGKVNDGHIEDVQTLGQKMFDTDAAREMFPSVLRGCLQIRRLAAASAGVLR
ncbi:DUF4214 domain-containing protein [Arhodomonas sp. SL1]|uniref:DUF4214 domain-containing protein n=1 Tax=Arhodomonas sp. SL1 TaxID=3425691 RepID=UPI003F880B3B